MQATTIHRFVPLAVLYLVLALLAAGCSGEKSDRTSTADTVETAGRESTHKKVPSDLVLRRLDGKELSMGEYRGKRLVIYFWASWHNDSRKLVEIMNAVHRKYARSYRIFAVSMDEGGKPVILNFMRDEYILCDVIVNGAEVARAVGGVGKLPTLLVVLPDGRIVQRLEGLYTRKKYEKFLGGMIFYRD